MTVPETLVCLLGVLTPIAAILSILLAFMVYDLHRRLDRLEYLTHPCIHAQMTLLLLMDYFEERNDEEGSMMAKKLCQRIVEHDSPFHDRYDYANKDEE